MSSRATPGQDIRCPSCTCLLGRIVPLGGLVVEVLRDGKPCSLYREGALTCLSCGAEIRP